MARKMVVEPRPIRHPEWRQPGHCAATPAAGMGEAHRGEPVMITVPGLYTLTVTASLYKANAS